MTLNPSQRPDRANVANQEIDNWSWDLEYFGGDYPKRVPQVTISWSSPKPSKLHFKWSKTFTSFWISPYPSQPTPSKHSARTLVVEPFNDVFAWQALSGIRQIHTSFRVPESRKPFTMLAGFFLRQLGMHMLEERYERFKGERSSGFSLAQIFHVHDPEIYKRRSSITLKPTLFFQASSVKNHMHTNFTVTFFLHWLWVFSRGGDFESIPIKIPAWFSEDK